MHAKASFVFWVTLILYLGTLFIVSYVGVYSTFVAIPLLVVSGLLMMYSTSKPELKKLDNGKPALQQVGKVVDGAVNGVNSYLGKINKSLSEYNDVNTLVSKKAKFYKDKVQQLELDKVPLDINLKYEKSPLKQRDINRKIDEINKEINNNEEQIDKIRHTCELEVKVK